MSKISFANWTARALRVSAFLWTLTAGAVLALATIRAEVINGLTEAGPMSMGSWYDMADLLIPYYAAFGGVFPALTLLTGILWVVQRRTKKEPSLVSGVIA